MGTTVTTGLCVSVMLCARFYRSGSRVKVVASGKGQSSDKNCESVDAPVSFKSSEQKHFGFLVSRNKKGDRETENRTQTLPGLNYYTTRAHIETLKFKFFLIIVAFTSFSSLYLPFFCSYFLILQ